jgi:hypothetical protein
MEARPTAFSCCFCGQEVKGNPPDICALRLTTEWTGPKVAQREETLFAHARCLRERVHEQFPLNSLDEGWD